MLLRTLIVLLALAVGCVADQPPRKSKVLRFDLARICGGMPDDHCSPKGRFQDGGSIVIDEIIAGGKDSVPVLIGMLTDTRRTKTPIEDYWSVTYIGDIAFMVLADLFLDSSWQHATVPGTGWEMLGADPQGPAETQLRDYILKHGRASLKAKWTKLWEQYKDKVYWDEKERCFKPGPESGSHK